MQDRRLLFFVLQGNWKAVTTARAREARELPLLWNRVHIDVSVVGKVVGSFPRRR
jgi:hypothetical protein